MRLRKHHFLITILTISIIALTRAAVGEGTLTGQDLAALERYNDFVGQLGTFGSGGRAKRVLSNAILRNVQLQLKALGYDPGGIDGKLGSRTRSAIQAFQKDAGLPVTGAISRDWVAELSAQTLRNVQEALKTLGHDPGPIDGQLGPSTRSAIREFQKAAGLPVTGELSPGLVAELSEADAWEPVEIARKPVRLTSLGRSREIVGRMRFSRNSRGNIVGCSVKNVRLDVSWCSTFVSTGETKSCTVGIAGSRVLHVMCQ